MSSRFTPGRCRWMRLHGHIDGYFQCCWWSKSKALAWDRTNSQSLTGANQSPMSRLDKEEKRKSWFKQKKPVLAEEETAGQPA